jgi:hypothetical protein
MKVKRQVKLQYFNKYELNSFIEKIGDDPKAIYTTLWTLGAFTHTMIRQGWTDEEILALVKEATSGDEQNFYQVLLDHIL